MLIKEEKLTRPDQEKKTYFPYAGEPEKKYYGKRNKLGGKPDWIQNDSTPVCPSCSKKMTFYGQLDSINDNVMIDDAGIIYVFYCFDCGVAYALAQSN